MAGIRDKPQKEGETPLLAKLSNCQIIASKLFLTSLFVLGEYNSPQKGQQIKMKNNLHDYKLCGAGGDKNA